MSTFVPLIAVILKIVSHFLENKTPESKKNYVKNLEEISSALAHDDVESVNDLFNELRESAREGDPLGFGVDEKSRRIIPGDGGLVE